MFLGRKSQGDWLGIPLLTGTSWPASSGSVRSIPTVTVFDENQDVVTRDEELKPVTLKTGLHLGERQLGPEFAAGRYVMLVEWNDGGASVNRTALHTFEVVPVGHSAGAYVGLHFYRGQNSDYLLGMTDGGLVESRKGPKV